MSAITTTTRDIAARAEMSPAAVYVHYASKEDLLQTLNRIGYEAGAQDVRARDPERRRSC